MNPLEEAEVDAVAVGLADQPQVDPAVYEAVTGADGEVVVPQYDGQPGNPVKLARSLWPEALNLRGDVGARDVVRRHLARAVRVDVAALPDVDDERDYQRLVSGGAPGESGLEVPEGE